MGKRCLIISGGEYHPITGVGPDDFIIACDRGYEYALRAGIRPDLLISDFDSYGGEVDESVAVNRLPTEKDDTDTMSAIRRAVAEGCDEICLLCALGGRLDHSYANLQALAWAAEQGALAAIDSPDTRVFALRDAKLHLPRREGFSLSVFAVSDRCRVSLRGVKYALEDAEIGSSFPIGVSNEWAGPEAEISVRGGTLLIMESRL